LLISPGCGDPEAGVNQNQRDSMQRGKKSSGSIRSRAGRESWLRLQEKGNI
jgi:hypothetical protein